jgi:hypothetical protein
VAGLVAGLVSILWKSRVRANSAPTVFHHGNHDHNQIPRSHSCVDRVQGQHTGGGTQPSGTALGSQELAALCGRNVRRIALLGTAVHSLTVSDEHTLSIGALVRTGYTCERVRHELADCDSAGLERARTGYNNAVSFLSGMLDEETRGELITLCPPITVEAPTGISLAYAGLSGWINGLLSGVQLLSQLPDSGALDASGNDESLLPAASPGFYM